MKLQMALVKSLFPLLAVLVALGFQGKAEAQHAFYGGYTRSGTVFGCASAPRSNNGYWMIKSVSPGVVYAENSTSTTRRFRWQVSGLPPGSAKRITWVWQWYNNPSRTVTNTVNYVLPPHFSSTGASEPRGCW